MELCIFVFLLFMLGIVFAGAFILLKNEIEEFKMLFKILSDQVKFLAKSRVQWNEEIKLRLEELIKTEQKLKKEQQ